MVIIHVQLGICTSQQDQLKQLLNIYIYIVIREWNDRQSIFEYH